MKTYQDLLAVGDNEQARMSFVLAAIQEHRASEMYRIAYDAELYDRQLNPTIMNYRKILYTISGKAVPDNFSANHKVASNFFNRFITQETQYLLGNGVTLENEQNKEKLGKDFDVRLQEAGRCAVVGGVAYGFMELMSRKMVDPERYKLRVFKVTEFVPLVDENNGALMAGIRFWQVDSDRCAPPSTRLTASRTTSSPQTGKWKSWGRNSLTERESVKAS